LLSEELQGLYSSRNNLILGWSNRVGWLGGTRGTYETQMCRGFWWINLMEWDHLGDLGVHGMILHCGGERACTEGVDRWRAVVHTVVNLWAA
jgi:hypothetical protein